MCEREVVVANGPRPVKEVVAFSRAYHIKCISLALSSMHVCWTAPVAGRSNRISLNSALVSISTLANVLIEQ